MGYYLAWEVLPYLVWIAFLAVLAIYGFKAAGRVWKEQTQFRCWGKTFVVLGFIFLAQLPWKYDSTSYQNYRLHFNKDVEYNGQQIERTAPRESWEERSEKLRSEARNSANERTIKAMKESK